MTRPSHDHSRSLEDFLKETRLLIKTCEKQKTTQPLLALPPETRQEMAAVACLLSEEWSHLFLTLILYNKIEDLLSLEDILTESANRDVLLAIKNLLERSLTQPPESNLLLYKLRRLYYTLATYYSDQEPMLGYDIPIYKPPLSLSWVKSLEDIA